jgi:DNA-binding transcriptional MerR regulator
MNKNKTLPFETFTEKSEKGITIPDKLYFRISEVSKLTGLEPYVLRYWESEFKLIKPIRTKSRHRLYRRKDLNIILEIKRLLYEEQYTIAGAKKRLEDIIREERSEAAAKKELDPKKVLLDTIEELKALRKSLS